MTSQPTIELHNEDCLEGMKRLEDGSIDFILTDLPYNLTACKWDKSPIDLAEMWQQFRRVLKPCCSAALFASGKFTYKLVASNFEQFKYKWFWIKNAPTFFVQAKNAPMRKVEEILVFSDGVITHPTVTRRRMKYNPQGLKPCLIVKDNDGKDRPSQLREGKRGDKWTKTGKNATLSQIHNIHPENVYTQEFTNYPTDALNFNALANGNRFHPTQKPVDLLEYLIRTYTNEGETVLDATMGSGSTGVAAVNTGRNFVGFELEEKFFDVAQKRIDDALAEREQRLFA